eukprot:s2094_g11.t1
MQVAASETLMKQARINFGELKYAKSTAIAKESKAKLVIQIAEARNLEPFPLTPAVIGEVGAVLRAADFSSGASYLSEAKQVHLRKGFEWDNALDLAMQDAERALTRALGPVVKAEEIPPKLWRLWQENGRRGFERKDTQPGAGPELWGMGSAFLLREVELAHLLMGSVTLDMESREATLLLSMSKTDPAGRGARRTRSCTCSMPAEDEGELDCPFHSTVLVMAGRTQTLRRLGYSEEELKEFNVVGQVSCPTIMVSKEAMIAALKKDVEAMCRTLKSNRHQFVPPRVERVTGHSLRRSRAKDAVKRHRLPLAMVQWLGRWGSSAVQGYVEDALEEMPENKVALTTWEGLARKTVEQAGKFEEIEKMIDAVKGEMKSNDANTKAMVQEIKDQARPKLVMNLSTLMVHATARSDSGEWNANPYNWVTRCGGWRWAAAGRLAKPLASKEQVGEAVTLCAKCRPAMIAEELIESSVPKETGLEGARCFHLLWAEGLPPEALVSVRCGQKSRQASVEDLLTGRKRLEIGEGSLVQVKVLVRESMIGLPPPFVEEQLHQVQFPRVQSEMRPCGRCHRALPRPAEDLRLQIRVQYAESSTPRLCYYPGEGEAQKQYLVDHDLHDFGQQLIRELVEASYALPVDFLSFLGNKLSR